MDVVKMNDDVIPRSNCVGKETLVYLMTNILIRVRCYYSFACTKVCGVVGVCFKDKKASCHSQSYVFAKCAYTNDDQIMIPSTIHSRASSDMNLTMHR